MIETVGNSLIFRIDGSRKDTYQTGSQSHERTHGKAHPDNLHGLAVTVNLGQQVIDYVRDRENDYST